MKTLLWMALFIVTAATPVLADVSKEDLLKLAKAGVSDDEILALLDREGAPRLSADDLIELKQGGVSDRVIKHVLQKKPQTNLVVVNASFPGLRILVDQESRIIALAGEDANEVVPGAHLSLRVPDGEYTLAGTVKKVRIPARITFHRTKLGESSFDSAVIEDPDRSTVILSVQEAQAPATRGLAPAPFSSRSLGPGRLFPWISERTLLGAGLGAIIGHQRGERTKGALIGAAAGTLWDYLDPEW